MKYIISLLLLLSSFGKLNAQVLVPVKIDTTQGKTLALYQFINSYMQQDTISNELWHPKYKGKAIYNYTMDWIWGQYTPKKISKLYDLELSELQILNDSLAYFKLLTKSRPKEKQDTEVSVYKFYIVKIGDRYYLDNCKPYDDSRFKTYATKNIIFHYSPFYKPDQQRMNKASEQMEVLYSQLRRPHLPKPLDYYLCATEEELNNLSNIVIWTGGLGAFTNIPEGYVVAINDDPLYKHEFVHAILQSSANCFFMQEGIASLYGGMNKGKLSYEQGIRELKAGYLSGKCHFDNLYAREVKEQYNGSLTYTFAAAFCKYLIDQYGLDYFYKLYYNKEITTENFLQKVSASTGKTELEIKQGVEAVIFK
ncbi:hypothetical protein [Pedobacter gandavensis]|uniref:hypothetical protein n=1 Tax=Pedobacter gandavensis TaxID=2679963 RepID=UPI0029310B6C|nr:hypothetical protein [Pedobacter gandavensis]